MKLKRNPTLLIVLLLAFFATAVTIVSCSGKSDPSVSHYTCPMHPEIKSDKPGTCPICHMDLIPVPKETSSSTSHEGHDHQSAAPAPAGTALTTRQIDLAGIQTEKLSLRPIIKNIVTQGRVAFNPKWWQAETELVEAIRLGDASLVAAAKSRLSLMGAGSDWISEIEKSRKPHSAFIGAGSRDHPIFEASVYSSEKGMIAKGSSASIISQEGSTIMNGTVVSVGSITDPNSRSIAVLVAGEKAISESTSINQFVQIVIHHDMGEKMAISNEALLFNGDHIMAYAKRPENHFEPVTVTLGAQGDSYSEIQSGLTANDEIVVNGHFLLDSETRLKGDVGAAHQH